MRPFEALLSIVLGMYVEVEVLGHMGLFLCFEELSASQCLYRSHFHGEWSFPLALPMPTLVFGLLASVCPCQRWLLFSVY